MSIDQVFQGRAVRVLRHGIVRGYASALLFALFGIGFAAFAGLGLAPELRRDLAIQADLGTTPDARISGTCRTRKAIFVECAGSATYRVAGRTYTTGFDFFFVSFETLPTTARVVFQRSNPANATIDAALDNMTSRLVFAGAIAFAALACFAGAFGALRKGRAADRGLASMRGAPLEPVEVLLTTDQKVLFGRRIGYKARIDGREVTFQTVLPRSGEPYWLPNPQGLPLALGVTGGNRSVVVLLDRDLSRLEMNDAERRTLDYARAQTYGVPRPA